MSTKYSGCFLLRQATADKTNPLRFTRLAIADKRLRFPRVTRGCGGLTKLRLPAPWLPPSTFNLQPSSRSHTRRRRTDAAISDADPGERIGAEVAV